MQDTAAFSPSTALTLGFAAVLIVGMWVKFWLATRQIRHVAQHRGAVPPAFTSNITLDAHQKAADYTVTKARFGLLEMALGTAVLLGWTLLGGLNWLNQSLLAWLGGGMWQQLALLASFVVIGGLIDIPMALYQTFVIEERFGFNKTSLKLWLADMLKSSLVGIAIGLPIAALILWLMGSTGQFWWLWAWSAWMGINLVLLMVYPTFIAPLFNKFTPLQDVGLRVRIERLLDRCGFRSSGVFVMDGSKRSSHGNAYFTGLGRSKRIVFFDTLLEQLDPDQTEAVLAHELGHYSHRHVLKRIVLMFGFSLALLLALAALKEAAWFYAGLQVTSQTNATALALFFLVLPVFLFPITPLMSLYSRRHEFQADAFAAAQSNPEHLVSALVKLYRDNASTLTPDPIHSIFYDSHPRATERIARLQALTTQRP